MNLNDLRAATPRPPVPPTTTPTTAPPPPGQPDSDGAAAWCLAQHIKERGHAPAPGDGHNIWLTQFTEFCNERGAPLADALALGLSTAPAGHDNAKIRATVEGIYKRKQANHGSKPYTAPGSRNDPTAAPRPTAEGTPDVPPATSNDNLPPPTFPPAMYDGLPDYLRRCCEPFDGHERAVMLLGTLAVLSGCFPGVGGIYNRKSCGLNLFVFVIAPPASGKGTLNWAQRLARPWHKRLLAESAVRLAEYEAEQAAHKAASKGKGQPPGPPPAAPPPRRMLYLPGNTSAAAMLGHLAENEGRGIICESEADTLSGALGADFGNFSDMLRKAFHHEAVSVLRKADRQHLDLERPALSIALTGTPGQLPKLIPTAEDGLMSRFLFYLFTKAATWQDVSPAAGPPLDGYFDGLADELTRMIEAVPTPDEATACPVLITLSAADWERVNEAGHESLAEAVYETPDGTGASTAMRLGLIAWRIVGILTVLRCFENGEALASTREADPADVTTALTIMHTARAHALAALEKLPTASRTTSSKWAKRAAEQAKVKELQQQGLTLAQIVAQTGMPKTTVHRYMNQS